MISVKGKTTSKADVATAFTNYTLYKVARCIVFSNLGPQSVVVRPIGPPAEVKDIATVEAGNSYVLPFVLTSPAGYCFVGDAQIEWEIVFDDRPFAEPE